MGCLIRPLEKKDLDIIQKSLYNDKWHTSVTLEDFTRTEYAYSAYEDEFGLVAVARVQVIRSSVLLLDCQFITNDDEERNGRVILYGLSAMIKSARKAGYTAIEFTSQNERLVRFCVRRLGFVVDGDLLRKAL